MSQIGLDRLLADGRENAIVSWLVVGAIGVGGGGALAAGRPLWIAFAIVLLSLAVIPPVSFRSWRVMLPWEVLFLAALPMFGLALGGPRTTGHFTAYLSVAAVALVLAVELQAFTSVEMTAGFAIVFVAITTMAAAAIWALFRWWLASLLGVPFPTDHDVVMWEFVYSTGAGLGAGAIFEVYFRRLARIDGRLAEIDSPPGEPHE
ncbi:hypothetical protein C479_01211 [Halovivax asiaticus JCM 14624]|uniref:Uncharacterized protein n=1 Tax=Halovivax asiaticus JCM 14624 TaxID=1227490 RepID=M0BQY6_9EURY|nr:hypothetical protein [Halovivax asiaticus]ELZ13421.1 hypothetical protein C479_01211 [Halovivax asiaticus JCM 14624]